MSVRPLRRLADEQDGAMIALFAVLAFALLLVAAFVIDVGNWQEHRRHLQVQVDDGATATGIYFTNCFLDPAGSNTLITREAHKYAGDPDFQTSFPGNGVPYNLQVDDPSRVVLNLNRPDWPPPETDYDINYDLDPTQAGTQNTPCDSKTLLIRAKDQAIPSFFGGVVPAPARLVDVRAKARVEIDEVVVMKGFLPWAVPEIRPKTVAALFVNEANPPTANVSLVKVLNPPTQTTLNGQPLDVWAYDGLTVAGGSQDYGLVVVVSTRAYADGDFAGHTLGYICALPAVTCHSGSTQTSGLDFIHGYPRNMGSDGTPGGQVTLQDVQLVNGPGCDDSSPYFQWKSPCTFGLTAEIDFGALTPQQSSMDVRLDCGGGGGGGVALTYNNTVWNSPISLTIPDGSGRNQCDLSWRTGNGNCNSPPPYCGGTTKIAVPFSATDDSAGNGFVGGIRYVAVKNSVGGLFANSLGPGDHLVKVEVGLQPPLRVAQSEFEPPIMLRLASKSGSLNQALDCDHPNLNLEDEVRDGCQTFYKRNERDLQCSGPTPADPVWTPSNLPPPTFLPPSGNPLDSPDCVAAKTGDVTAMAKGLHDRFEAPPLSCPANHWIQFRNTFLNQQPLPNDPRFIFLIVTEFSAFSGSGATVVPVEFHAGFYITGWFHQQSAVGCPDNDPPPPPACPWPAPGTYDPSKPPPVPNIPACDPASNLNKGNVWGYFVTAVPSLPGSIVSEKHCVFGELQTCAARLVE